MKRLCKISFILMAVVFNFVALGNIYQTTNKHGAPNFSDQVSPYAKIIILETPNTYQSNSSHNNLNTNSNASEKVFISIISPLNQQIFQNQQKIAVVITCRPTLLDKQRIELWIDGALYKASNNLQFSLQNAARGKHKLEAKISEEGKILAISEPISIFVNQYSIYNK